MSASFISDHFPHVVEVPPDRSLDAFFWCSKAFGGPARSWSDKNGWSVSEKYKWDYFANSFHFREQKDAAFFKVFFV